MKLSNRDLEILNIVIRSYILNGEPVGSKTLRDDHGLNLSPATIRSSMNRLCEAGLLCQPHTSAGRIPTSLGYQYFIHKLIPECKLDENAKRAIDSLFPGAQEDPEELLDSACSALADITGCVSMLTPPQGSELKVYRVRLVPIDKYTAVLMFVTTAGIIKSRFCRFDRQINADFLSKIDACLAKTLVGRPLDSVNAASMQNMLIGLGEDALYAMPAVYTASEMVEELNQARVKLKGQANLFSHREYGSDKLKPLLDYLHNEPSVCNMLSQAGGEITVILGSETGEKALKSSGLIVTKYKLGGQNVGAIGILGPDRMNYETIIPSVLYFKESLGRYLTDRFKRDMQ